VALVLASRRTGVTRYPALRSSDFPRSHRPKAWPRDRPADSPTRDCSRSRRDYQLAARKTAGSSGSSPPDWGRTGATLSIRRASPADARAIAENSVKGWQEAYRDVLPRDFLAGLSVDTREIAWRTMLESDEDGRAPSWLAERDGRPIGFVACGPPRDEDVPLPAAEVYALYVLPDHWRSGVGKALLSTAVDHCLGRGATALVLWVLESNARGRAFYEALGWNPDGSRQNVRIGGMATLEVRYLFTA
jgi:GNAT superfamily N-acetyltransferase